jgi:hypothetical protein
LAAIEVFADIPQTQVTAGGTTAPAPGTSESWTVASSGSFPVASSGAAQPTQFHISDPAQASEIVTVTNISGLTWTVTRGAEGTTPVAHTAGFTVKQVVTSGGLGFLGIDQNAWCAPGAVVCETLPRSQAVGSQVLGTTNTLFVMGVGLPQYLTVSTMTMVTKATAAGTLTHGWYVLLDSSLVVRAVTADQTSSTWTATQTAYALNFTAAYTTTYTGLYYIGINVSAGTLPAMVTGQATASALAALAPVLCGSVSTGYSATPPAVTTALSGLAANSNYTLYAGLS